MRRSKSIAIAFIASWQLAYSASAAVYYLGIGEDNLTADIGQAVAAISPWVPAGNITSDLNPGPAAILADINAAITRLVNGDVFIFHYSGHGFCAEDAGDLADPAVNCEGTAFAHADWLFGPQAGLGGGVGVTDDQLTTAFNRLPASAATYMILDSCHAGLAVHDNGMSDLATTSITTFIATADAANCAPDPSDWLPEFLNAFALQNGTFTADSNNDRALSVQELYNATNHFVNGNGAPTITRSFGPANHLAYAVARIPEPATLGLAGIGLVALAFFRRRLG